MVIDFGTATTFDVVDFDGAYKGGIIAPGINLSLDALVNNTAKLPRIAIEDPRSASVIGRNTEDQMQIIGPQVQAMEEAGQIVTSDDQQTATLDSAICAGASLRLSSKWKSTLPLVCGPQ